jgi:hypothetical protein
VFWSLVANVLRVTLIVIAAGEFGVDLSEGWLHEVLGHVLLILGFLLLLSTDQLLAGLLAPMQNDGTRRNRWAKLWNALVTGHSGSKRRRMSETTTVETTDDPNLTSAPVTTGRRSFGVLVVSLVVFVPLIVVQLPLLVRGGGARIEPVRFESAFAAVWLPERLGAWERASFEQQERDASSDEGQYSQVWRYRSKDVSAHISIDYPFSGWHELSRCYVAQGWRELARTTHRAGDRSFGGEYVEVEFVKPTGETGFLLFALFDGTGGPLTPRSTHWRGLRAKIARSPTMALLQGGESKLGMTSTSLQVQLFIHAGTPPADEDRQELRRLFLQCLERIHRQWRSQSHA